EDAVEAYLHALHNMEAVSGRIFNLGGGPSNSLSLRELLDGIRALRGVVPEVVYGPWRPGDQAWYISDIRALQEALDWQPRASVRDGLARLHDWLSARFAPEAMPKGQELAI